MGRFVYNRAFLEGVEIEDRTLVHLRFAFRSKSRRGESFMFNLPTSSAGSHSFWIDAGIPVTFYFYGKRYPSINQAWVDALIASASSPDGLVLIPEPPMDDLEAGHLMQST